MNLLLHCGAHAVEPAVLPSVYTPKPTRTWQPIPHHDLLGRVKDVLPMFGLRVNHEAHALTHGGGRYFGLLEVQNGCDSDEYSWVLGIRNSHDKSFPAGIVAGTQVLVCDNLAFSGEVKVARKHTRFILRDLPELIQQATGKLIGRWQEQERRVDAYKLKRLADRDAHDMTIRALDTGVINTRQLPDVLHEWREPRHAEFQPRNTWSWFNAVTESIKGNLAMLPRRTSALHALCDARVGLN